MHCNVQTFDFGTKVRNLFNAAKGYVPKNIAAAIGVSPQLLQGSYRDYNRQKHRLAGHEKTAPWQRCKRGGQNDSTPVGTIPEMDKDHHHR